LRSRIGDLEGKSIWIVGDVLHSRVARSCAQAFSLMGARITLCGPPTLVPAELARLGYEVTHDISGLGDADVAYALRIQQERMSQAFVPSLDEYIAGWRIDGRRLGPRQLLMHPGPVIRGLEVAEDVIDSPNSLIAEQVSAGLFVRMAVLYEVLSGRGGGSREDAGDVSELHPSPLGEPA
jgi:aspartate carbamoyltransferase catalytic subunit